MTNPVRPLMKLKPKLATDDLAARISVSSVALPLVGSSNRSSWARHVCISSAMRDFVSPRSFIAAAICSAIRS
jgi:hypothetical protein